MPAGSVTAFAPGRVNLLGEHTDYNGGLALSLAIEEGVTVRATTVPGPFVLARARDLNETDHFDLHHPQPAPGWRGFLRGAAAELAWAGNALRPAKLEISGTVPRGRGLGSSSALSVSLALAMLEHAGLPEGDRLDLARLCSRIEGEWAGGRAALLDHLTSLLGRAGHALRIDFATFEVAAGADGPRRLDAGRRSIGRAARAGAVRVRRAPPRVRGGGAAAGRRGALACLAWRRRAPRRAVAQPRAARARRERAGRGRRGGAARGRPRRRSAGS